MGRGLRRPLGRKRKLQHEEAGPKRSTYWQQPAIEQVAVDDVPVDTVAGRKWPVDPLAAAGELEQHAAEHPDGGG